MSTQANKAGKTLTTLAVSLLFPIIVIIFLVKSFNSTETDPALLTQEAIEERIAPVAQYNTGAPAPVVGGNDGPKEPLSGEQVYKKLCMTCHDAGLAGAPKMGDSGAWAPRIAQGEATVFKNAIEGFNGMPARGGDANLSDLEVKRAVVYMVNASGGNFAEPSEGDTAATESAAPAEAPAQESQTAEAPAVEEAAPAPAAAAVEVDVERAQALLNSKACTACHSVDNKVLGPSFKEVGAKYAGEAQGLETIAESITKGSTGKWGAIPMPGNPVTEEEAKVLAAWILSLK